MYYGKYGLLNDITMWRSSSGVNRIRLWPPRRDDHSGILVGARGMQRSDWPVRV